MPFQIVRDDITKMRVDAVVNTANPRPNVGSGLDAGINAAAGPELLKARIEIGEIAPGEAAITLGFNLPAKYVIHAIGPYWIDGEHNELQVLSKAYASALHCAAQAGCCSIAMPLMSTGNYGFPKPLALKIAINEISSFLLDHDLQVYLVVFNREAFQITEKLFSGITSFIDDNYVEEKEFEEYSCFPQETRRFESSSYQAKSLRCDDTSVLWEDTDRSSGVRYSPSFSGQSSLTELLKNTDAGFSDTLLDLIDEGGYKDSDIYKRANITKQHFYKIRKNPDYKPSKPTAIALAIALRLDLDQTKDLIGRAGYALTNSSKFDVIIMYFIREKNYNLFEINAALFEFDQCLLGGSV